MSDDSANGSAVATTLVWFLNTQPSEQQATRRPPLSIEERSRRLTEQRTIHAGIGDAIGAEFPDETSVRAFSPFGLIVEIKGTASRIAEIVAHCADKHHCLVGRGENPIWPAEETLPMDREA